MKKFLFLFLVFNVSFAQIASDSIQKTTLQKVKPYIIPATLIAYGVIGIESDGLKFYNTELRDELKEHIDKKITIDDFSQYLPAAAVYGLNAMGIEGKHNFKDRTVILTTSYLILTATILPLKTLTKVERPDGTSFNSFPSGHTATAFAGAEFLWQEYKDVSVWYGVGGYVIASATGILRVYNNRHWLSDIITGAGIGILSTKAVYWIYPYIKRKVFKEKSSGHKLINAEDINKLPVETYDN